MRRAVAGGLLVAGTAGCRIPLDSFDPTTPQGLAITSLFNASMLLAGLVFLLVAGILLYALLRYRIRPSDAPDEEPPQIAGSRTLEIAWTAAPALLLVGVFGVTLQVMRAVDTPQPSLLPIRIIGHSWWWELRYPDQGIVTANELHVPVGVPLRLELTGADVIHSFWVPQLGWKKDAIPGRTNVVRVYVERPGIYEGACAEFCGVQHAWMRSRLVAQPREEFDVWVRVQQQLAAAPPTALAARGREVFLRNTCVNCHTIQGTPATAQIGPDLTHLAGRATLGAGVVENTPDNVRRFIRDPHAIKPGVLMPGFRLSDDDLDALVAYLEALR